MDLPRVLAKLLFCACLAAPLFSPAAAQPPEPRTRDRDILRAPRFHDPSTPIKDGRAWYVFSTGRGLLTHRSEDLKTWSPGERVFKEAPAWHREVVPNQNGDLWAPDVIKIGKRYLVYYSVSSFGKQTSAIGLATSPTLDPQDRKYEWKDGGIVVRSDEKSPYNAIDPQMFTDDDGSLWMVFGSFWKGIFLLRLDPETGLRDPKDPEPHHLAWNEKIEASAILKHKDWYYLFVNWGKCCEGVNSTYEIRIGRSKKITGPYVDMKGQELATGGGTLLLKTEGDQIGPGHASFIEEKGNTLMFYHYYDRKRNGVPVLGSRVLNWTDGGWPRF